MKRLGTVLLVAATGMLAACGTETAPPGEQQETSAPGDTQPLVVDADAELVAHGMLIQTDPAGEVEMCVGGVAESLPPQCSGPVLEGEFSWDDVESESASGVRWSVDGVYAVGHFKPGQDLGTFALTRPVSADLPEGFNPPSLEEPGFPQLCDDPTADVPDVDQSARTQGPDGFDQEQALSELTQGLDGYVTSWLSGGGEVMNVVVNTDAEVARAAIREVVDGPLCVEQRDLPTEADLRAAQEAVGAKFDELHVLSSGSGGVTGMLDIYVLMADQATVDRVHEVVAPWLTPEQVMISSALVPLN